VIKPLIMQHYIALDLMSICDIMLKKMINQKCARRAHITKRAYFAIMSSAMQYEPCESCQLRIVSLCIAHRHDTERINGRFSTHRHT